MIPMCIARASDLNKCSSPERLFLPHTHRGCCLPPCRVGQYRLCKSYLQGLPAEAAEQLVLAASREVYLSASSMKDPAVKQVGPLWALRGEGTSSGEGKSSREGKKHTLC